MIKTKYYPMLFTVTSILLVFGMGFVFFAVMISVSFIQSPETIHNLMLADSYFSVMILAYALRFLFFKRILKEAEISDAVEREDRLFNIKVESFVIQGITGIVLLVMTLVVFFEAEGLLIAGSRLAVFCTCTCFSSLLFLFSGVLSRRVIKKNALSDEDWTVRRMSVKMLFVLLALIGQFLVTVWVK